MNTHLITKKWIVYLICFLFVFQAEYFITGQTEDEIVRQFYSLRDQYLNGQYYNARKRIERLIGIITERQIDRRDIMGQCYLLLGAISEKEASPQMAEELYGKARDEYGMVKVDGVMLETLDIYRRVIIGPPAPVQPLNGSVEKEGLKKERKKFPWLIVAAGAVVLGVVYFLFLKPKKQYKLAVTLTEGVEGTPAQGIYEYEKGAKIHYRYTLKSGFEDLKVLLDGVAVAAEGDIDMNREHVLSVSSGRIAVEFVTDVGNNPVSINYGQTAVIQVWLNTAPLAAVNATVERVGGSDKITINSGGTLHFDSSNYTTRQNIVLLASDTAAGNEDATFRISASGIGDKYFNAIIVREMDPVFIITGAGKVVDIRENSNKDFYIKLSTPPSAEMRVDFSVTGDEDIRVKEPPSLVFSASDWNTDKKVTIEASHDPDTINGEAVLRIFSTTHPLYKTETITFREVDNDVMNFNVDVTELTVREGGTAEFNISLSMAPAAGTTLTANVARVSGDLDITVIEGSQLVFNEGNYSDPQRVRISAAEDNDFTEGKAVISISSNYPNVNVVAVTVTEDENDVVQVETDVSQVTINEDGATSFQVRLNGNPASAVQVTVSRRSGGDNDISVVSGQTLNFGPSSGTIYQQVVLNAIKDEDTANGSAIFDVTGSGMNTISVVVTENDNYQGQNPDVKISTPGNGDTLTGKINISVLADDDIGLKRVECLINNNLLDVRERKPYNFTWDSGSVLSGSFQIKAVAYDNADKTDTDIITVNIVNGAPAVVISAPVDGAVISGKVTVSATIQDDTGISAIDFYFNNTKVETQNLNGQTSALVTFELDTTAYANGNFPLRITASDGAKQETSQSIQVTVTN